MGGRLGDVVRSPDGDDTFDRARLGAFDRLQASVRVDDRTIRIWSW